MMGWHQLLRREKKAHAVERLRARLEAFRELLDNNNRVLRLIGDAGEKLGGDYLFDSQYLRWLDEELAAAVGAAVQDLHRIAPGRYRALDAAFHRIRSAVRESLESPSTRCEGPLCLDIDVGTEQAHLVGEKMARLGEMRTSLALPVPPGFVLTTCAFRHLMDQPDVRHLLAEGTGSSAAQRELGERLVSAVTAGGVPPSVRKAIRRAASRFGRRTRFAVRSSAPGEDGTLSFAGIYTSLLNVPRRDLSTAYVQVVASLFGERACQYRLEHREPIDDAAIAVGCMAMVPAAASGVLYTLDPARPEREAMTVSAAWGLGSTVVEGSGSSDAFTLTRSAPVRVLERRVAVKETMQVAVEDGESGTRVVPVPAQLREASCVSDAALGELGTIALAIERHMRCPVDMEWAVDSGGRVWVLQARPLRVTSAIVHRSDELQQALSGREVLLRDRGVVACRGIGAGRVVVVSPGARLVELPPDSVLVASYPSPRLSNLVPQASALVTNGGSSTGHLATIAREHRVPAIFDTRVATATLRPGMEVTVDAEENIIYSGVVPELLRYGLLQGQPYEDTREFRILRAMLKNIEPLRLRDPEAPTFSAGACASYHDVVRFAHEKALTELSNLSDLDPGWRHEHQRQLALHIPLDLVLVDVGGGIAEDGASGPLPLSKLTCHPLRAVLEGLTAPGMWATSPAEMDLAGFMASATRANTLSSQAVQRNLAIVSSNYLNLSLRLGYHATVIDSFMGAGQEDSYVRFRFVGGVTEVARRARRASLLCDILSCFGFVVEQKGDLVVATLGGVSRIVAEGRLGVLGRLVGFSRQLDIVLRDEETARQLAEAFLVGECSPSSCTTGLEIRMARATRVMVVDDEPTVGERLKDFLERSGMEVESFVDSEAAVSRLEKAAFDVVVTDLRMAGPSGLDVLVHIRRRKLPTEVIIITAYANIEDARGADVAGVFEFVQKPFRLAELQSLIGKAARKARRRAS